LKQTNAIIKNRVDLNIRHRHWKRISQSTFHITHETNTWLRISEKKGALTFLAGAGVYTIDARRE
jgi:ribosomal protein S11